MSPHQLILENSFWKFLVSIEELKEKKEIVLICSSLSIEEEKLKTYCAFLTHFKITVDYDEHFIYPLKCHSHIKVEFSLSEWLSLEASLQESIFTEANTYFSQILSNKLRMVQKSLQQPSLFQTDTVLHHKNYEFNKFVNFIKRIDYHVAHKKLMKLNFENSKECDIFPHRQVYLDGVLCVVGENITDRSLCYFEVKEITEIVDLAHHYEPNLSQIEINEFISYLRMINGREERLVLKIYSQEEADLLPQHHFLGNPFVTSNTEGDMIWAATIEICDDVYQWLYEMNDRVEILDPGHVRKDFAHYCELKKESTAKKAS